jgi:MinD superfamily P-loop ATPase
MIYTFYSYKGGVGRSMAIASVAQWLYLQGLNVFMVDWDLEAPGLEELGQWNRLPSFDGGRDLRRPPYLVIKVPIANP